jgi:hypothetical protein
LDDTNVCCWAARSRRSEQLTLAESGTAASEPEVIESCPLLSFERPSNPSFGAPDRALTARFERVGGLA